MSQDAQPESALPQDPQILAPGLQVGRFRVEAFLGSGGMGEVYQAWDPTLERSVALKALRPGEAREAGATERFRREALLLAQLNHPNVCQVHDWVDGPEGTFIAMELVQGQTLDHAAGGLTVREKLQVLRGVARALEAAHAKGVVHRDLKPGNIMVGPRPGSQGPEVKVLDFGLARLVDPQVPGESPTAPSGVPSLALLRARAAEGPRPESPGSPGWDRITQAGTFMGSPSYASPEQIQGQAAGSTSDIFSLGILAWELLAGEHPFPGEGRARMQAILRGARRELKVRRLPAGTADLVRSMLDPHPFKRPTAARVAIALEQLLRPRGALRWAVASALGALALGWGATWFLGRGIAADLTRQRPARLVVMPLANATGDAQLDSLGHRLLPEMLEAGLRGHPKLALLDQESLARARTALHLPPRGPLGAADEARLAAALGAQLILRGRLSKEAGGLVLAYDLQDAEGVRRHAGEVREPALRLAAALPLAQRAATDLLKAVDPFASAPRATPDLPSEVLEAYARGADLMDRGDFKGAAPAFEAAARQAPGFAPAVLGYARCLSRLADAPPEPVFQWALWAARAQGARDQEMRALHHLAARLTDRGQWEAADQAARQALELAQSLGETTFEAGIRTTLGVAFQRRNRIGEAEAEYRRALDAYRAQGDGLNASRVLNNLAVMDKGRGDLGSAQARYEEALRMVQAYGDKWGESFLTNNLGDLALAQEGGLDRAEGHFRKALALREAIGDQNGRAYSLLGLASVAQTRGELDRAEGLARQFLDLARRTQQRPLEALALYNLGELARTGGRLETARSLYRQSLALHQELKDALMETHCLAGEAECLARDGRRGMARALLERSRALSTEETPYILRAQAWLARAEGRTEEARLIFAKALAAARTQAPEIARELKEALRG